MNKVYLFLILLLIVLGFSFSENAYAGCQWYTAGPFSTGCVTGSSYDYIFEESWMDHAYNNGNGPCQNPPNSCSKNDALCAPYSNAHYSSTSYYCPGSSCGQVCSPNTPAGCAASCANCTYIDEVLSWTECIDGFQVADDVHQKTIPGTICSNVSLSRSCISVCTGTIPTNATMFVGDDVSLTANTPYTYWATDTGTRCQYSCSSGYIWNGLSCVPTPVDGACNQSWHQTRKSASTNFSTITNLCSIPSIPDSDTNLSGTEASAIRWNWICPGQNNGDPAFCWTDKCTATEPVWGSCNKSCGGGTKTGTHQDADCNNLTETQACNSQPCPPGYREVAPW